MILDNVFSPITFWKWNQHQVLDVFSGMSGKKIVNLDFDAEVKYVFVVDGCDVDINFNLKWKSSRLELFGIFVGDVKSQVVTSLLANNTYANIKLFSLVKDDSTVCVDWNVFIWKNIEKVEGHLAEEQFLLWKPKHLFVRPILDVCSNNVKASHWAKIHTLDQQKLFYMMSKGLSLKQSHWIVVKSLLQSIFDSIVGIDNDKKQNILNQIFDSVFNYWK